MQTFAKKHKKQGSPVSVGNTSDSFNGQPSFVGSVLRHHRNKTGMSAGPQISKPGDSTERRADATANEMLRGKEVRPVLQSLPLKPVPTVCDGIEPGRPIAPNILKPFENASGTLMDSVRIHTGPSSSALAEKMNANAFASGNHIVFGDRRYAPETPEGRSLLAHELSHVIHGDSGVQRSSFGVESEDIEIDPGNVIRDSNLNYMMGDGTYRLIIYVSLDGTTGHAYVGLKHAITDEVHIRGFYAACTNCDSALHCSDGDILQMLAWVDGVVCDDTTTSYDTHESFEITDSDYDSALELMFQHQADPPSYRLAGYNCTNFVVEIAGAAGVSISLSGVDEPSDLRSWIDCLRSTCNPIQGRGPVLIQEPAN